MMFDPETLLDPITPPAGATDSTPVLASTHAKLVDSLRFLSGWFDIMARTVDQAPWADGLFDDLDIEACKGLRAAQVALEIFRATRDCRGQG